MVFVVDDLLELPGKFAEIIFNALVQTINKTAWTEYSRELKKLLLRARHDYSRGKINKEKFKKVEKYVFREMKVAKQVLSKKGR